ncbi:hypothetical protein EVAR_99774_1 [Eumeta japonica]|uniref:Uncharacterized protein n=1 Tax=Eumeta variegata TaxID=151549 RepID=A0A4C1ZNY8_EUMVA|nr:hypothetical protein EVAR_99774_1 [Eumeta japonica]
MQSMQFCIHTICKVNLADRSSRLSRGRAEVSVDRGLRGPPVLVSRGLKNDSLFTCSKTDCRPAPPAQRRRILSPGSIIFLSIGFVRIHAVFFLPRDLKKRAHIVICNIHVKTHET